MVGLDEWLDWMGGGRWLDGWWLDWMGVGMVNNKIQ